MSLSPSVFHDDVCNLGKEAEAYWIKTVDDIRLRIGVWGAQSKAGTVLLFPGRTEYLEKYSDTAAQLQEHGYCTVAIDWRGQGLADRLCDNQMVGHVENFPDYQKDIAALLDAVKTLDLPQPYYLLGHSMGGAIGLQALMEGLSVKAAAFSAPMWGIQLAPHMRALAWVTTRLMPKIGMGEHIPPGTSIESYVLSSPFEDNLLTTYHPMYEWMQQQLQSHPDLGLGAPSYIWLRESLNETEKMSKLPSPKIPAITFLGSNERIVDKTAIHRRMENWDGSELVIVPNAEHEILMESDAIRRDAVDQMAALFASHV